MTSEQLQKKTLAELKTHAQQLGLTKDHVSQFGDLRKKSTWETALDAFQSQTEPETTVSDNLFEPLVEPEVINITRENSPEIWQHLEPPTEPGINWISATSDDCCYDCRLADYKGWKISTYSPNGGIVAASIHKNGVYWQVSTEHLEAWFDAEFHIELAKKFIDSLPPESETVSVTYQVITDPTPIPPIYFSRPEQKHTLPKLPGQDFFVWLFSPPKVSVINQ